MAKKSNSTNQNQKGNTSHGKASGGGNKGKRRATELPSSEPDDDDAEGEFWVQTDMGALPI